MRASWRPVAAVLVVSMVAVLTACTGGGGSAKRLRVVASFYPLAWAARQIAPGADVKDLTPRGGEAHDLQLTARQRMAIQEASVVLILGKGFQPDVERAARDSQGRVVDLLQGLSLLPSKEKELQADPHVWLDPELMRDMALKIAATFADVDDRGYDTYLKHGNELGRSLEELHRSYRRGLASCPLHTLVTTHEAFGYLAKRYGLTQVGLSGLTPEAEPTAAQIQRARELARHGEIAAIFFEESDEGARIGRSVAGDVRVPALPLSTLESDPAPRDYRTQMERNLVDVRRGLRCR